MKAENINPFITSTLNVFKTMVGIEPKKGEVYVKSNDVLSYDVSAVIGLAGKMSGFVVISFPEDLALEVTSQFLGEQKTNLSADVTDAIGELINMITGSSKKIFSERGYRYNISVPNVITGKGHIIQRPSNVIAIGVKFHVGDSFFVVEVALRESE